MIKNQQRDVPNFQGLLLKPKVKDKKSALFFPLLIGVFFPNQSTISLTYQLFFYVLLFFLPVSAAVAAPGGAADADLSLVDRTMPSLPASTSWGSPCSRAGRST